MILGQQEPWLPQRVKNHPLPREVFLKIIRIIARGLHRLERFTHLRLEWLVEAHAKQWLGFFVLILVYLLPSLYLLRTLFRLLGLHLCL